jgi:hypothetical protein
MTNLARAEQFRSQSETIQDALNYFSKKVSELEFMVIERNARAALTDANLFEAFEMWNSEEISDEALLYQLREYLDTEQMPVIPEEKRDLTKKEEEIARIKSVIEKDFAVRFAKVIQVLAASRELNTNEKLANFLEMNEEQVRVLCKGEHKPQRKTLVKVAEKFSIPLEAFL